MTTSEAIGASAPTSSWTPEGDMAPGDFLIGCLTGAWVGDDDSVTDASAALLAATFTRMGLDAERAVERAYDHIEAGASLTLSAEGDLSFTFDHSTGEPESADSADG